MKKALLLSVDFLDYSNSDDKKKFLSNLNSDIGVIFYSRDENRLKPHINLKNIYNNPMAFLNRKDTLDLIKNNSNEKFIVIGSKNKDFEMAVNNKILLITPQWYDSVEDKAIKYGIPVNNVTQLDYFIKTVHNQNYWYSSYQIDESTYIFSLSDARSKYCSKSAEEKEIIEIFHNILKEGKVNHYETYLYHFLASMSNNSSLFNDINIWGIFPSSSGSLTNNEMFNFKEKVRYFMKGGTPRNDHYKKYQNILIRHTATTKSHYDSEYQRLNYGATKHFNSICLNPGYMKSLKGKNVCIFDDYLTHGNSFECARNLLRSAGVNKIIFVTLGTFRKNYQLQNYKLSGNIFSSCYKYELLDKSIINSSRFTINNNAKDEVENLHNIFNL